VPGPTPASAAISSRGTPKPDAAKASLAAPPGHPAEVAGQDAIRAYFTTAGASRELSTMEGVEALVRQTDDPEVIVTEITHHVTEITHHVTEITHHGWSRVTSAPYRFTALGVIRVQAGRIVRYDDYMDPIALARLLGRTDDLAAALTGA